MMHQPSDTDPITIESINQEGQGLGHVNGKVVFVDQAMPGDTVTIRLVQQKNRYARAAVKAILKPSPDRIQPACPVAGSCGGCTLQALRYGAQLAFKRQHVVDCLQRIAQIAHADSLVAPTVGMDMPVHYRSKVQLPVSGTPDRPLIGFYASGSHRVIDTDACMVQPPVCDRIRACVRQYIQREGIAPYHEATHRGLMRHLVIRLGQATGAVMVGLVINGKQLPGQDTLVSQLHRVINETRMRDGQQWHLACVFVCRNLKQTNQILSSEIEVINGPGWIEEQILGLTYRISPLSFFQVNPIQTVKLFQTVLDLAGLQGHEHVLDLYCGTGSISLQLARQARTVTGIEVVDAAVVDARTNAEMNGLTNASFQTGYAEDIVPELLRNGNKPDLVVVDPPRKGCDTKLIDTLCAMKPTRLIYVSCNPATLARDIALLGPTGLVVKTVQPVDLFPWTTHVETVVLMSREGR